jgi:uncharacterized protein YuzE
MKVRYDRDTDVMYISFNDRKIIESDEDRPGIVIDYDDEGGLVGIEILNASKRMEHPTKLEYELG